MYSEAASAEAPGAAVGALKGGGEGDGDVDGFTATAVATTIVGRPLGDIWSDSGPSWRVPSQAPMALPITIAAITTRPPPSSHNRWPPV